MGMASSQVRLLMITNRLHDIEYKAQCIQNAKIMLSMLEDDAYQDFLAAQEGANTITIGGQAAGAGTSYNDIVNGLGVYMTDTNGNVYAGSLAKKAYDKAQTSNESDPFKAFAWYMSNPLGLDGDIPDANAKMPVFTNKLANEPSSNIVFCTEVAQTVTKANCNRQIDYYEGTASNGDIVQEKANGRTGDTASKSYTYYTGENDANGNPITKTETVTMQKHVSGYEDQKTGFIYGADYFDDTDKNPARKSKEGKFVCILKEVPYGTDGAVLIDKSKLDGKSISNETFFNTGVTNGKAKVNESKYVANEGGVYLIEKTVAKQEEDWKAGKGTADDYSIEGETFYSQKQVKDRELYDTPDTTFQQLYNAIEKALAEGKTVSESNYTPEQLAQMVQNGGGGYKLNNTTGSSGSWGTEYDPTNPFNYSVSTGQDSTAIAKASAKYEAELRKIDRKEKQYDTELAKIETERTALTKEMDGIKKVKDDNIERTFGIFS